MAAKAGYLTSVKRSGTPTAFTNSVMTTATTVANTHQLSSTVFRVWDRFAVAPTFASSSGGGSSISSTDVSSLDYLFGKAVFKSSHSSVYVAAGTYLPLSNVAGAHTYSLSLGGDLLDNTDFTSTGYRSRQVGLRDVSVSITRYDTLELRWFNAIRESTGSTVVVIDITPGGSSLIGRGFFKVGSADLSGDVGSLEEQEISAELDASTRAAWSWSDL